VSVILFAFFDGSLGRLRADPVFEGDYLWSDRSTAKVVSQIDLYAIGTNLWKSAEEERAGKFLVRAALDKARYQLGEPIHLFLYYLHHSQERIVLPHLGGWEPIRPAVVDHRNSPLPLTPAGKWQASFSDLFAISYQGFPTNQVKMMHIDLTEMVKLTEPGQYLVFPRILLISGPGTLEQPSSAELRAIPFEVTATRFERPANAPPSVLAMMYQQHLDKLAGREPPLTDEEKRIRAEQEQWAKEQYELARPFFEAEAFKATATNLSTAPPVPLAPATQRESDAPPRRPLRWPLLAAGAALLTVLGWLWRQRGA
jgi:hypothetical protein